MLAKTNRAEAEDTKWPGQLYSGWCTVAARPRRAGQDRLAAELAVQATAAGWKVAVATHGPGAVHPPPAGSGPAAAGPCSARCPLLVDYADRWPLTHLTWLFSNALFHRQVRLLRN